MRAQRAPVRPTFSPARLCHVVYAGFSGGQMEDYPCVGQHISRRKNARRLSPSDLRTTLPDLRALAKRPLASPHRAANWRRSVDDQPRACSQHRRARLSLQASAREGLAETPRGLGQAAQNDARFGGADRRKTDARAVESRSDQRASGEGWRRLDQSRAHGNFRQRTGNSFVRAETAIAVHARMEFLEATAHSIGCFRLFTRSHKAYAGSRRG